MNKGWTRNSNSGFVISGTTNKAAACPPLSTTIDPNKIVFGLPLGRLATPTVISAMNSGALP